MRLLKSTALSLVIAGAAAIAGFASPAFANTCSALGSVVTVPACYFFPPSLTASGASYTADFKVTGAASIKIFTADGALDNITGVTLTGPGAHEISLALNGPTANGLWTVAGGSSNLYDLTVTFATPLPAGSTLVGALSAVPLPPALALFGGGLAGLALLAALRKRAPQPLQMA